MTRTPADDCATMAELRTQIDALDAELIALLAERATYIDRAIALKPGEGIRARAEDRVAEVVANVRALAQARDLDPDLAERLWSELIEWSIARERREID
ncbi:isochorismate pyruvate lyase [Palleronia salina]|uniref:chorismate mutase n=1 Tax=Palleronia salina TaxID=313368 RepID=A0A1M6BLG1_9RHOB|nr:isochorismate pyruvate lyase [Palleronia salina]